MSVLTPYLIQRCSVKKDYNDYSGSKPKDILFSPDMKIGDFLTLDYMGSAEYEFGSFPRNTRNMFDKLDKLKVYQVNVNNKMVFVLCSDDQIEEYSKVLEKLAKNEIRLKDYIRFDNYFNNRIDSRTEDTWVDLDNQIVFSMVESTVTNFKVAITNSVNYMNLNKR